MSEELLQCTSGLGDDASSAEILNCVATSIDGLQQGLEGSTELTISFLLVICAILVFFMQAGFAMLCAGAVRKKNVQNTMLKNLLDACGAAVAYYCIGYAFSFGGSDPTSPNKTFIGHTNFFLMNVDDLGFWLFQYAFSAASCTIVAGTLAERCQMAAYLCYSVLLVGFVYPVIVHSIWSPQGFLSPNNVAPLWGTGVIDFAGGGVVHLTGGMTALYATMVLGPRQGRFHDEDGKPLETPKEFPGHSMALQMLGAFILWFGWYGFNAGSALTVPYENVASVATLAGVNTTLAAGMGGITALFLNLWILERATGEPVFDLRCAMYGTISGLVAVTAGCGVMEPWAAVVVGFVSGLLYIGAHEGIMKLRIDDAVDAIPCHLFNGIWGLLAVGFFASPGRLLAAYGRDVHVGWVYSFTRKSADATLLGIQCIAALFIIGWTLVLMMPFFVWLDWKGWFRADALEEVVGLDMSYHGGIVLGESSEVNPEYISAFNERKRERKRRHSGIETGVGLEDEDFSEEYVDAEAGNTVADNSNSSRGETRL